MSRNPRWVLVLDQVFARLEARTTENIAEKARYKLRKEQHWAHLYLPCDAEKRTQKAQRRVDKCEATAYKAHLARGVAQAALTARLAEGDK